MKKVTLAIAIALLFSTSVWSDSTKLTTTNSASADKVGDVNRPGLLFKFDLSAELQKARIDLAYLRFKVEVDTTQQTIGLLVRPMLESWASGSKLSTLLDSSAASPYHVNFGRVNLKDGAGKIEITQTLKAWQTGELQNLGFLVYPSEEKEGSFKLQNLTGGGLAELEIFYTAPEVVKTTDSSGVE